MEDDELSIEQIEDDGYCAGLDYYFNGFEAAKQCPLDDGAGRKVWMKSFKQARRDHIVDSFKSLFK